MISISKEIIENLIVDYKKTINIHLSEIRQNLYGLVDTLEDANEEQYVQALLSMHRDIITLKNENVANYIAIFDGILVINSDIEKHKIFKDKIIKALCYKKRRTDFYPEYFRKIGIRACVYCNSQLCVTVENIDNILVGRFQVDHYIPKDKYPCFSTALFNLYPVCSSCNNKKGVKKIQFLLYQEPNKSYKSNYSFGIENKSDTVANYLTNRDSSVIKIKFNEPQVDAGSNNLNDLFSISGIYDTQIDIVEELILKAHIYNDVYRKLLLDDFKDLFKSEISLNRLIVGNYVEEDEIHKRPMAKFMQDIARQLELI